MNAIVLAGGFGTRLRGVIDDVPKPMAPVGGRPFLEVVLGRLIRGGASGIILSTGYMHERIESHFGSRWGGVPILYSRESEPLGTGGAIAKAVAALGDGPVAVANGDTYLDADLADLFGRHESRRPDITVALKEMHDESRYGLVETDDEWNIVRFREKAPFHRGWVNAGIYLFSPRLMDAFAGLKRFSFEEKILAGGIGRLRMVGYPCRGDFIDIGIPEDYRKAIERFA